MALASSQSRETLGPQYRRVIDESVRSCRSGQGQIGATRAKAGVWNANADDPVNEMPEQRAMNDLLRRLSPSDRQVVAGMLAESFVGGVHETLAVLHEQAIPPFEDGYESTPFHDSSAGWPTGSGRSSGKSRLDDRVPARVAPDAYVG